jgi:pyruvate kinase
MFTKIIATLGPVSADESTLSYFKNHAVEIARLNFSHDTVQGHTDRGLLAKSVGLELLVDLGGPKIRLGEFMEIVQLQSEEIICLEHQNFDIDYPRDFNYTDKLVKVLPCRFEISESVVPGRTLLLDDGKVRLEVVEVVDQKVFAKVVVAGSVKSGKSVNLPYSTVNLPFLTDRDKHMLRETIAVLRPEYVACSFVKTAQDVTTMKDYIQYCLDWFEIKDYFPKICVKLETHEVLQPENLEGIIEACDIAMVARGDMALETLPAHVMVPQHQDEIVRLCQKHKTPFIIATEALDSMIDKPTPSRAEISDIYRSIVINKCDYIMLSGETAGGKYPREAVGIMYDMIERYGK